MKDTKLNSTKKERGQSLIEFVLVMPMVLMFCFMVFDVGRAVYYTSVLRNAAREGARYGSTQLTYDAPTILSAVQHHAYGLNSTKMVVTSQQVAIDINPDPKVTKNITAIMVTVSYDFVPATPLVAGLLPGDFLTLNSQATMRIENQ